MGGCFYPWQKTLKDRGATRSAESFYRSVTVKERVGDDTLIYSFYKDLGVLGFWGFGVLGFSLGLGFGVWGLVFGGFGVWALGSGLWGLGLECKV